MASVPVFCRDLWAERKKSGVEWRKNPFRLLTAFAATFPKGTAEPSQSSLRDASSPEGGAYSVAGTFLITPNTLAMNLTAWLSL